MRVRLLHAEARGGFRSKLFTIYRKLTTSHVREGPHQPTLDYL